MSPSAADHRRHLALDPGAAESWRSLAFAHAAGNEAAVAAAIFVRLLALRPQALDLSNLAELRRAAGLPGALRAARRALVLDPALAAAHNNRGNIVLQQGRPLEAETAFRRALALHPAFRDAIYNLAVARNEQGDPAGAVALYERALGLSPDFLEAHWNRALALLAAGRWRDGWQAHEVRRSHPLLKPRDFPIPDWTGEPLAGRRILVASEQGLGDTIQFLRYVPEVALRGGRVTLDLPAPLVALARSMAGIERLVERGAPPGEVEVVVPMMSLPFRLGETTPPAFAPYLAADPERRARWRRRLAGDPGPRIGIAWAGNPGMRNDHRRSLPDAALAPLAGLETVRFVSLQKERKPPEGWLDAGPDLVDFAETAALVAELDLVIAVDTAVAHLAGALGRPLWVLLSSAADWRWPRGEARTPWYASARQVWQGPEEGWEPVIRRLARALARGGFDPEADLP